MSLTTPIDFAKGTIRPKAGYTPWKAHVGHYPPFADGCFGVGYFANELDFCQPCTDGNGDRTLADRAHVQLAALSKADLNELVAQTRALPKK